MRGAALFGFRLPVYMHVVECMHARHSRAAVPYLDGGTPCIPDPRGPRGPPALLQYQGVHA